MWWTVMVQLEVAGDQVITEKLENCYFRKECKSFYTTAGPRRNDLSSLHIHGCYIMTSNHFRSWFHRIGCNSHDISFILKIMMLHDKMWKNGVMHSPWYGEVGMKKLLKDLTLAGSDSARMGP